MAESGTGHSIWLLPDASASLALAAAMKRVRGVLESPGFDPHITLLPDLHLPVDMLVEHIATLASRTPARDVRLLEPRSTNRYWRAFFLPVASDSLHALVTRTMDELSVTLDEPYEPHISLAYGRFSSEAVRRASTLVVQDAPTIVRLDRVRIMRTEGPLSAWKVIEDFPLQ